MCVYIFMYVYTHTPEHTHTLPHIYIHTCVCGGVCETWNSGKIQRTKSKQNDMGGRELCVQQTVMVREYFALDDL